MKLTLSGRVRLTVLGGYDGMRFYGLMFKTWCLGFMRQETTAEMVEWEESHL